jgi:signal transduction histidine kinase
MQGSLISQVVDFSWSKANLATTDVQNGDDDLTQPGATDPNFDLKPTRDYSLKPILSEFTDLEAESEYRDFRYPMEVRQGIYAFLGIGILLTLSCVREYVAFSSEDVGLILKLNGYRLGGAIVAFGAAFVAFRKPKRETYYTMMFIAGTIWTIVYGALAYNYFIYQGESGSFVVFPLLALMSVLFAGHSMRHLAATVTMVIVVSIVTHSVFMKITPTELVENLVLIFVLVWAGAPFSLILQRVRRSDFANFQGLSHTVALLETENKLRQNAEKDLKAHRDNLEELVRLRTSELEASQTQLFSAQKMESLGQLAGGVAHDFNNLLQAILGYGDMAITKATSDSPILEDLSEILKAAERARALVHQLLAFSRGQTLELTDVHLDRLVVDLVKLIERVIGEHVTLECTTDEDLWTVRADRGQIEQIIVNLCINARDAMGDGGTLTIETSNAELDERYCANRSWAAPGGYVLLSVTDTGCGMDEETQGKIFEPFFTTKEEGKGTGLGLSTVFGITRQHDGIIDVSSEVGVGTTVKVYFPKIDGAPHVDEKVTATFSPRGRENILLADDDENVRRITEVMLSDAGYSVLTACDGVEATRLFDEQAENVDMAILDVVMPKLGGKAVADHIARGRPDVPILFCSGYDSDAIHTNFALDEGAKIIQKPYHRHALLEKVREVLENAE